LGAREGKVEAGGEGAGEGFERHGGLAFVREARWGEAQRGGDGIEQPT